MCAATSFTRCLAGATGSSKATGARHAMTCLPTRGHAELRHSHPPPAPQRSIPLRGLLSTHKHANPIPASLARSPKPHADAAVARALHLCGAHPESSKSGHSRWVGGRKCRCTDPAGLRVRMHCDAHRGRAAALRRCGSSRGGGGWRGCAALSAAGRGGAGSGDGGWSCAAGAPRVRQPPLRNRRVPTCPHVLRARAVLGEGGGGQWHRRERRMPAACSARARRSRARSFVPPRPRPRPRPAGAVCGPPLP